MSVSSPQTEQNDEVEQLLSLFGLGGVGASLRNVRPGRLSTVQEMVLSRAVVMRQGALTLSQFAENPWGFPPIPYPGNRNPSADRRLLLAPSNVSFAWLGHPIYWIDPALTAPTDAEREAPARWAVRMFYLIMAMGLWDVREGTPTPLAWFNAPATRGINPSEADHRAYCAGQPSALDLVRFDASDLHIGLDEINRQAQAKLAQLEVLQTREWTRMRQEQRGALRDARELLATPDPDSDEEVDEDSSALGRIWPTLSATLRELSGQLARRVHSRETVQDLVSPIYDAVNALVDLLNRMERTTLVLSSSVLREVATEPSTYASVATELELYAGRLTDGLFQNDLYEVIDQVLKAEAVDPRSFARLYERAEQLYADCWRRLTVAEVNFGRVSRGEPPYADYAQYQLLTSLEPEVGQRLDSMDDLAALSAPEPTRLDDGSAYDDRYSQRRQNPGV